MLRHNNIVPSKQKTNAAQNQDAVEIVSLTLQGGESPFFVFGNWNVYHHDIVG